MCRVWVEFTFPIATPEKFTHTGNIKETCLSDIVSDFIRCQLGAGADHSPAQEREVYHIRLDVDLTYDSFTCTHDCGNLGLRDGILMDILSRLPDG